MLNIILAATRNYGIGIGNMLPWNFSEDLVRFRNITTYNPNNVKNIVIMGRLTAESMSKPLPNRINIVLTRQDGLRHWNNTHRHTHTLDDFVVKPDLISALEWSFQTSPKSSIFVIGGAQIVRETLKYPNLIKTVYLTQINDDYKCDVFIPELGEYLYNYCETTETISPNYKISYYMYQKKYIKSSEQDYLNVMATLLRAPERQTRNAITKSIFSSDLTFDLQDGFPLLTTKKVFWNGIVNELLFFLGGCTDNGWLQARDVHIWDANTSKEFLQKCNLPYEENTLGPCYGFQWRYYGAKYKGKSHDYSSPDTGDSTDPNSSTITTTSSSSSQGKDQFAEVIDLLINDPYSRRILMTTYNYDQVKEGVLMPCHGIACQFYVEDNVISLKMTQRSGDWFLGVCYNIASYALLLEIIVNYLNQATKLNYRAGRLHLSFGDCHLYQTHYRQALIQIARIPRAYPKLVFKENITSIDPKYFLSLSLDNFIIENYNPYPGIKASMVA